MCARTKNGLLGTSPVPPTFHLTGTTDWNSLKALPENRPVLVYCEAGGRSEVITEELRILGHPYIVDLIGGMEAWSENDRPVAFDELRSPALTHSCGSRRNPMSETPGNGVSRIP